MSGMAAALARLQRDHPWRHGDFAGLPWRWRDTGRAGVPLLLLPGALGTADIFVRQMLASPENRRLVAVDYPAGPPERLADGLAELVAAGLGLPRADAVAASFAGWWLQHAAARHPMRFRRLVLANTFASGSGVARHPLFDVAALRSRSAEETHAEWHGRLAAAPPSELRDLQLALLAEQPAATLHDRLLTVATAPPAPAFAVPAGIVECADDPLIPPDTQAELRGSLPRAPVARLPAGGHYPHVSVPDAYAGALARLLRPGA